MTLGVFLVAIIVLFGFLLFLSKAGSQYAGVVTSIQSDSFTIVNRHGNVKEIKMDDAPVFEGRGLTELRLGDFVIVVGDDDDKGAFQANIIRIVKDGPEHP